MHERPSAIGPDGRTTSDLGSLSQEKRVLYIDAKIAYCVLDLRVAKQDLDGTDVSRRLVDHRRLRASERVCPILLWTQSDCAHSLIDQARVLPRAHVACVINPARERIVVDRATASIKPSQKAGSNIAGDFELNRSSRLLLHNDRTSPDLRSGYDIANPDLDQVTAAKLAVD